MTLRQWGIVDMVAEGLANKEIAVRLGLSEGTVKVYLARIYRALGISDGNKRCKLVGICQDMRRVQTAK